MSDTNAGRLMDALKAELGTAPEIVLYETPPSTWTVPAVVVIPGDPFLTPSTHGTIEERWEVLVTATAKDRGVGVDQMRTISNRVRKAITAAGGLWRETSGPRIPEADTRDFFFVINRIAFKTQPN